MPCWGDIRNFISWDLWFRRSQVLYFEMQSLMLCIACCRRRREVEAELKQEFSLWEALKSLLGELPEQYGGEQTAPSGTKLQGQKRRLQYCTS